jgi:amino acid permease
MTPGGWIWMIVSLTFVWGLTFWCYRRVLASPQEEKTPVGWGA